MEGFNSEKNLFETLEKLAQNLLMGQKRILENQRFARDVELPLLTPPQSIYGGMERIPDPSSNDTRYTGGSRRRSPLDQD